MTRVRLLPKCAALVAVAAVGLALAGLGARGALAVFTSQATVTGNTFTTASSTGFKSPSATGEDFNQWVSPSNAFSSDNAYASTDRNGRQQDWYNFSFGVPGGATILGIEVSIEGHDPDWSGNGTDIDLSWDGGISYTTTGKGASWPGGSDVTNTFGGWTDTWGRTWSDSELSDANFRLRLTKTGSDWAEFGADHIQVKVYYRP